MTSLEFSHEIEFSKINFIERKTRITHPKTIIQGAPRSGKSFLIFDYLSNFESKDYLYIDFQDCRNDLEEIKENIEEYVIRNKIKVIVFENFTFDFKIPFCHSVIISTKEKKELTAYKNISITPLDFEEYLLHDKKNQNTTHSFNSFLKYGNLPQTIQTSDFRASQDLQNLIKLINKDDTSEEIMKILILNIDEKKSLNQLYLSLKNRIKISKDKFYEQCNKLEKENIIYFISKYNQLKSIKKIYTYNPAFLSTITYKKRFKSELTNMIFLELVNKYKEIYYLDYIDFYIPSDKIAIVSIPFFNSFMMQQQLKRIKKQIEEYKIQELYIITVSNNEYFIYEDMEINVVPFYEWALS